MAISIKPLGNRIVVEPIAEEEVTAGGIVLPETAKEKPQKGTVLAAGPGERNEKVITCLWKSKKATLSCLRSIQGPKLSTMVRNC